MGKTQKGSVRHLIQLRTNRGIDRGMVMTMNVRPNGAVAVQVLVAMLIREVTPLPRHQHHRVMRIITPRLHGRERMPKVAFFSLEEGGHGGSRHLREIAST